MTVSVPAQPWLQPFKPAPQARLRLFCIPYAGGSAAVFRTWTELLPPFVELVGVELPGRGRRLSEPSLTEMNSLVAALCDAIEAQLDRPYAVFGHSLGALVGFELAREMRRRGKEQPARLFVSGRRAPHIPEKRPLYALPEDEFVQQVRNLNGTPPEVFQHPDLLEILLPVLRSDFQVCDTYQYTEQEPLDVPISAFGGLQDPMATHADLDAWRGHTSGNLVVRMLPGDHFFLKSAAPMLVRFIARELQQVGT